MAYNPDFVAVHVLKATRGALDSRHLLLLRHLWVGRSRSCGGCSLRSWWACGLSYEPNMPAKNGARPVSVLQIVMMSGIICYWSANDLLVFSVFSLSAEVFLKEPASASWHRWAPGQAQHHLDTAIQIYPMDMARIRCLVPTEAQHQTFMFWCEYGSSNTLNLCKRYVCHGQILFALRLTDQDIGYL